MSRATVDQTWCDLCGYGGAWTRPEDFHAFGEVDLCRWCADDRPVTRMSCGSHDVTFLGDSWVCSCGGTYGGTVARMRLRGVSLDTMSAAPNLGRATASAHIQRT